MYYESGLGDESRFLLRHHAWRLKDFRKQGPTLHRARTSGYSKCFYFLHGLALAIAQSAISSAKP